MTQTPADWYPDPDTPGSLRYWDGSQWTEHRHTPSVVPGAPEPVAQPVERPIHDGPRPDWYQDPEGSTAMRYWDGTRWTDEQFNPVTNRLPDVVDQGVVAIVTNAAPMSKADKRALEFERKRLEHAARPASAKVKEVSFTRAVYLGGLPHDPKKHSGSLYATPDCIGIGTFGPKKAIVPWSHVEYVAFGSEAMAKNNAGAVVVFGVLGGLAAKNSKNEGIITVVLRDGSAAVYQVEKANGSVLRGKLGALLVTVGVPIKP